MELLKDLGYGWRKLLADPIFSITSILTLSLGIGVNSAIFSVVNTVLLRPLPYEDPGRLVTLWSTAPKKAEDTVTPADFREWVQSQGSFKELAAYCFINLNITGGEVPERVEAASVTDNFFNILGVNSALGGPGLQRISADDESRVVVLSHGLWQRRFAGDAGILGSYLTLDGESYQVTGVMPEGFSYPEDVEMWVRAPRDTPILQSSDANEPDKNLHAAYLRVIGRLSSDVTLEGAQSEMDRIAARLAQDFPDHNAERGVKLVGLHEYLVGDVKPRLLVLLGAVGFVLLIACTNVANLLLARANSRVREMTIRSALGGTRKRLVYQMLVENMALALVSGVLGLLIGVGATQVLKVWLIPVEAPRMAEITLDLNVIFFTFGIALFTGLIFGLLPALQASRPDLRGVLIAGTSKSSQGRGGVLYLNILAVLEVALVIVLLIGAALMIKSLLQLQNVDSGFEPRGLLVAKITIPMQEYSQDHQRTTFFRQLVERVTAIPDVGSAAAVLTPSLGGDSINLSFSIEGMTLPPNQERPRDGYQVITPGYFETMKIPLLEGRSFDSRDVAGAPGVVIVSDEMARRYWGDVDPVGQRLTYGKPEDPNAKWLTVVGVVGSVRHDGLGGQARAEVYHPHEQASWPPFMSLVVRPRNENVAPRTLVPALRRVVSDIDPNLPISEVNTMEELIGSSISQPQMVSRLLGSFAVLALILAMIGIYGVLAYGVSRRLQEIGIRMALGAQRGQILLKILKQGSGIGLAGILLGGACTLALTKVLESMLYEVDPHDPAIFFSMGLIFFLVANLASLLPAYRASQVEPSLALRDE